MKKKLSFAAVGLLMLTGCGGPDTAAAESAAAAASASVVASYEAKAAEESEAAAAAAAALANPLGAEYENADELLAAFEGAGGTCAPKEYKARSEFFGQESYLCGEDGVVSVYPSHELAMENARQAYDLMLEITGDPDEWLVGENWVINSSDSLLVQETLGGEFYSG